jgi:cation diffusion facilitator CzcD-associated flavoprotein CzcO
MPTLPSRVDVAIVGAGFSGIGMAIALSRAGRRDFVVLEKSAGVGGTWQNHDYPGCACDTPSAIYSYSFPPLADWTRRYAPHAEILAYLRDCVRVHRLAGHIHTGAAMASATYDEAAGRWRVVTRRGEVSARVLVLGMGALQAPASPRIRGVSAFGGETFHSAAWDHACDLKGKRVAVIGTGASAAQIVPAIAGEVDRLYVCQRTAPWVLPKRDRPIASWERRIFRALPVLARARRYAAYWRNERLGLGILRPWARRMLERTARRHLRDQVTDAALRARLTPDYAIGCKRILFSDDYHRTFNAPHVELVDEPIERLTAGGIRTAGGAELAVDAIVYATGYHVTDLFWYLKLTGRNGTRIAEKWRNGIESYLGMTVADFPNMFLLVGPNSGLGHNSIVFVIEAQLRYITRCLDLMDRHGADTIQVRAEVQADYNRELRTMLAGSVWEAGGCRSWYVDADGINRALWPSYSWRYWWRVRRPDPGAFHFSRSKRTRS